MSSFEKTPVAEQYGADNWQEPEDTIISCNAIAACGGVPMLYRLLAERHARALADLALLQVKCAALEGENAALKAGHRD